MPDKNHTQDWVQRALDGDTLALSKLLASFHPVLYARVSARMEKAAKAKLEPEDILQQVYIEVFRRIATFENRDPGSFLNWVLTIVDNALIDVGRALHRQMRDIARERSLRPTGAAESHWNLLDQLYVDSDTPSQAVRHDEAIGALLACLSGLSDSHRHVIQLRFLDGRSVSDVASRLDKSPAAIVALTKRALEALRKAMDHLGDFTRG